MYMYIYIYIYIEREREIEGCAEGCQGRAQRVSIWYSFWNFCVPILASGCGDNYTNRKFPARNELPELLRGSGPW